MIDDDPQPVLRLHIVAAGPLKANLVGHLIERLDQAFAIHVRQRHHIQAQLRLQDLRTGSLIADLIGVADALTTMYEKREILAGFVAQINEVVMWLAGRPSNARTLRTTPNGTDYTTISALIAPIAKDRASQVTLQVVGDNTTVLIVTREMAEEIVPMLRVKRAQSSSQVIRRSKGRSKSDKGDSADTVKRLVIGSFQVVSDVNYVFLGDGSAPINLELIKAQRQELYNDSRYIFTGKLRQEEDQPPRMKI